MTRALIIGSGIAGRGRPLGRMPLAARRSDGETYVMMSRADLYRALADQASQQGVEVLHDKAFVDAERTADGVRARFAGGTAAEGDFLVGADGIHSVVRRIIDPGATPPRYVPVLNTSGYVPGFSVDAPDRTFVMQFGTRCFFAWMNTPDGGTVWFANPPMKAEPARGTLSGMSDSEWRVWLHSLVRGDAGPAPAILEAAPAPLTGWATYDLPVVKHWHDKNGRFVLIGDAAHATSPASGQGAAMALEDAVILAQCLRDRPDTRSAFAAFVALRRSRVERVVEYGRRGSAQKAAGPITRAIRDALLPIAFRRAAKEDGRSMAWLQAHHIEFETAIAAMTGGGGPSTLASSTGRPN